MSNGNPVPAWNKDTRRVVLSDATHGVGNVVLEEAQRHAIGTGGFTMIQGGESHNRFRLIQVPKFENAVNQNIYMSDAVIILAVDPRTPVVDLFLTRSKERHRQARMIIEGNNVENAVKWLEKINQKAVVKTLYICGTGGSVTTKRVCDVLLPSWNAMPFTVSAD